MSPLDTVLHAWQAAFGAARDQVELHRVLGFPAQTLPTCDALRCASLAALGAREALVRRVAPHAQTLRAKGILAHNIGLERLDAGVLVAIDLVLPYLDQVLGLVDGLVNRAQAACEGAGGTRAPRLRLPEAISAARGQTMRIELRCDDADRLVILAPGIGMTRALVRPPQQLYLTAPLFPGELIVYAENNLGWRKIVRPMNVAAFERAASPVRPFSRCAAQRDTRRAEHGATADRKQAREARA